MSFSIGFPAAGAITINGKSPATVEALSKATAETATGDDKESGKVKAGSGGAETQGAEGGGASITVQTLLKRMKELQELLRQQQQQLASAQAARYPTPEAKTTVVMGIQGQIVGTSGALQEVASALLKELSKGSTAGALINTTA